MLDILPHDGGIHEIRMARPPVNALTIDLVRALREAITEAPANGARGIVVSGAQGMFSAGVDVPALLQCDRAGVEAFWNEFFALCGAIAVSSVPTVAAITGHSPAGGAVISLFFDYRVMAHGVYKIGLNEVQVGMSVPDPIQFAMRRIVGAYRAERLIVAGAMVDAEQAHAIGLVDELATVEQVVTRAVLWLNDLLKLPPNAMLRTRAMARADLVSVWGDTTNLLDPRFIDDFFADETQSVLHALVARLKSR
ncbi:MULTISPECIES: enoyl-CoA hydratase/isomerase family protein [Luteibacter]|uniref:Enoyl-CoA hydratase/isomerase family protein n=1 Tax=Luteibacter flocculans TaxID=2780091 RepID=A0ABY4SZK0_9GAMM|nr:MULTISPECIES: enoyl-CoA hydratase/isomerase family protein [Luteibacter]URL57499.1 enoyl-CoA hydratase/isomerase family protein [Luteibacter flocculans]SFW35688.1 Enoyl-CoA hydratase/carnithine racemase [Luteibacter sp. UNCMF366Tsu5.1]